MLLNKNLNSSVDMKAEKARKIWTKNSQLFLEKMSEKNQERIFLTHTVYRPLTVTFTLSSTVSEILPVLYSPNQLCKQVNNK